MKHLIFAIIKRKIILKSLTNKKNYNVVFKYEQKKMQVVRWGDRKQEEDEMERKTSFLHAAKNGNVQHGIEIFFAMIYINLNPHLSYFCKKKFTRWHIFKISFTKIFFRHLNVSKREGICHLLKLFFLFQRILPSTACNNRQRRRRRCKCERKWCREQHCVW